MPKNYTRPELTDAYTVSEATRRTLLAEIVLSPQPLPTCFHTAALDLLFFTECEAIIKNCEHFRQGIALPQFYRTELFSFFIHLLRAAQCVLRQNGYDLVFSVNGIPTDGVICPRYLQSATVHILKTALKSRQTARISVDIRNRVLRCNGIFDDAALTLPRAVADLHGGRVLYCAKTVTMDFAGTAQKKTVCPRWHSPGTDGLIRDPLSCVNAGLHHSVSDTGGAGSCSPT